MVPATVNPPGHTAENWPVAEVAVWLTTVHWKFAQLDSIGSDVMAAVDIEFADTQVPTIDCDDELVGVTDAVTPALDGVSGLDVRSTLHALVTANTDARELSRISVRLVLITIPFPSWTFLLDDDAPATSIIRLQACKNSYTPE
jgi:hypothetical protein